MHDAASPLATTAEQLRRAQICHVEHRLAEAETLYRSILLQQPDHAQALSLLAMILIDRPEDPEAEAVIRRHLALRPNDGASLNALGQLRARAGDDAEAVELFRRAAQWAPRLAPIHNNLGVSLQRLGRDKEALAALDRAAALDPAYAAAHDNRGALLLEAGRFDEALDALLTALDHAAACAPETRASILDHLTRAARKSGRSDQAETALRREIAAGRADADVIEQLSLILAASGRADEAKTLRNDLARALGLQRRAPAGGASTTVLLLGGVGAGHIPIRYLLDAAAFTTLSISLLSPDQPDAPLGAVSLDALRAADVVFSTLGDVDHDAGQFDAAATLCERLGKPVVNPPRGVLKTGRDGASALFGDIPGLVVPPVERLAPADLACRPIAAPLLARPAGDHGGDHLTLLRTEAERRAYLAEAPPERLLVSRFRDFRSPDGHWRKYRLIFVDRRVYPYHLAIGEDWLVHYWRAEMGRSAWKKAEEEAFLSDWRGVFGPIAAAAIEEAARRLDLDYGGMDCALMADGRVLLFEANACMLLHLDESASTFAYKHRAVPPIRDAFSQLVRDRAERGRSQERGSG